MKDQDKPFFSVRLFGMFSWDNNGPLFLDFKVSEKTGTSTYSCFEEVNKEKDISYLGMLHPQARRFLTSSDSDSVKHFTLPGPLGDELRRAVWMAPAPKWAAQGLKTVLIKEEDGLYFTFKISGLEAILFPTGILSLHMNMIPGFKISQENVETAGKTMINVLNRSGLTQKENKFKAVTIKRFFTDQRQKESIERRLGENKSMGLVNGLRGEEVSMGDIMAGFLTGNCKSLMGDRFLSYSYLMSDWDGQGRAFTPENYIDLVRLSRGESDYYKPYQDECKPGGNGIINTFENVVFALSGEGAACWVKPTVEQEFLRFQFKEKYDTIYLNLYLLALHQRYALVDMGERLDRAAPSKVGEVGGTDTIEKMAGELRNLRMEVTNFYLRAFFQQPAVLTNHQEFYRVLQGVLGVSNLLTEVQHATSELEFLIGRLQRVEQNEQHNNLLAKIKDLISEQERTTHNELVLTLVVEFAAIPYK